MNMIFKLFSAGALMFLGVACTSCEKENENNKESDIPMEQVSYKAVSYTHLTLPTIKLFNFSIKIWRLCGRPV